MNRLPLDWQCPMCGLVNLEGRVYCERCTMLNPYRTSVVGKNGYSYPVLRRAARQKAKRDANRHGGLGAGLAVGHGKSRRQLAAEEKWQRFEEQHRSGVDSSSG